MRKIPIVIGTQFGDEGKGTTVDFLCSQTPVDYVVRFSGGPQTAHNVVTSDGKEHTFSQFGSGTFQGAGTVITEFMLVNPFNMIMEANHIYHQTGLDPIASTYICGDALLITPFHIDANQQREINRGGEAHGSCGEGIGETRAYALYQTPDDPITVKDILTPGVLEIKLATLASFLKSEVENLNFGSTVEEIVDGYQSIFRARPFQVVTRDFITHLLADENKSFVFEGSQGILLDEAFGFHPHTTWSDVTDAKARLLLERAGVTPDEIHTLGVTRTYLTRHGFGPFPSEYPESDDTKTRFPEKHNTWGRFQGGWRVGALDVALLKYALQVNGGFDSLVLTHCDVEVDEVILHWEKDIVPVDVEDLEYQEKLTHMLNGFTEPVTIALDKDDRIGSLSRVLESNLGIPVSILSYGPTAEEKKIF